MLTISLSPKAYFDLYVSNAAVAPTSVFSFYEDERKAQGAKFGEWVPCENDEEKNDYGNNPIPGATQFRKQFYDFPIDSPFVKSAPTN